jgi:Cu/Ag efflux protein CusF
MLRTSLGKEIYHRLEILNLSRKRYDILEQNKMKARWSKVAISLRRISLTFALLPALGMSICDRNHSAAVTPSGPEAAVATTTFQGEGKVISIDVKRPSIEIDHQEIKGLMPAMTMEFYVKDKSLLADLKRGDHIQFTLENGVGGLKITSIKRL